MIPEVTRCFMFPPWLGVVVREVMLIDEFYFDEKSGV